MRQTRFKDRTDAGLQLGEELKRSGIEADIVLAIPRGGLPLGRAVADAIGCTLDIVVAKKIGAPNNPEFAIGAVASDGTVWRNTDAMWWAGTEGDYFENERERKQHQAQKTELEYRGESKEPKIEGKTVVVVDDGVATGSTTRACLQKLRAENPDRLVLAVPVGPPRTIAQLRAMVDDLICLLTPDDFGAVGQYYDRFDQVSDSEARTFLEPAN